MANDTIANKIFGEASRLSTPQMAVESVSTYVDELTAEPIYIVATVVFTLVYLVWLPYIIRNRGLRWSNVTRSSHGKEDENREVVLKQQIGVVIVSWSLGIVLLALYFLRLSAQFFDIQTSLMWREVLPLSVAGVLFVMLYGWVVLKVGGYLTLQPGFVERIGSMKLQFIFFLVILLSPLFILSGFANLEQGQFILQLSVLVLVILTMVLIRHSFLLFMRQNFSILHWFLYLCGVEILPVTLLWAVVVRSCGVGG